MIGQQTLDSVMKELSKFRRFSHHPDCKYHHNQLVGINGHPICLGCFCIYSGMLFGILLLLVFDWWAKHWLLFSFFGLCSFSLPFILVSTQIRSIKMLGRFSLGVGIIVYLGTTLYYPPLTPELLLFRLGAVIVFSIAYNGALIYKKGRNNPCENCVEGPFPLCSARKEEIVQLLSTEQLDEDVKVILDAAIDRIETY